MKLRAQLDTPMAFSAFAALLAVTRRSPERRAPRWRARGGMAGDGAAVSLGRHDLPPDDAIKRLADAAGWNVVVKEQGTRKAQSLSLPT